MEGRDKYPSEAAERFQVRLPDGMREQIKLAADANGRSMNAEIVLRLSQAAGATATDAVDEQPGDAFEWAIVEVFGHRRHAGRAREEERFGAKMLRIDVPTVAVIGIDLTAEAGGGSSTSTTVTGWTTHWYGGSSIFSYTLTDEATALRINRPSCSPQRYIASSVDDDEEVPY